MVSLELEQKLWQQGIKLVAFCDEVGRGPLLGSVVAAAVVLPVGLLIEGVDDSKKLTPKKRETLCRYIYDQALAVGIGEVDNNLIDQINIRQASRLAMKQAVMNLRSKEGHKVTPDYLLIDAESIDLDIPQQSIIHGDAVSHGIAAASIVAKVFRDSMCMEWDQMYPDYGIASHKGYATKAHIEALLKLGATPLHRRTFLRKIFARAQQQVLFTD
ncbi:Ribonuclease H [Desulfotomaculum nigrificans CO-1-SRB]|uniref:Ribonuclease HII n=1 Tax=Desulfotomaculum nigrificans (strain DSM 14880 / VKM B-2319 / CO-1-SRB) TaxID=868595 RepID=F6B375_DESCC|nr:ribonuclease HII [Desulfotomaculum nigrificans]AEF93979.1 Ribonuclease H [Desulfotomaculum nigrificans CO-1-SRB]